MKILLTLLITCLLSPLATSAQQKTEREHAQLKGPVKTLDAYSVDFQLEDGRTRESKRRPTQSITFNSEGNVVERTAYNHLGNVVAKYVHTYDAKGRSTGYEEYSSYVDKTLSTPRRHVFVLDDSGNRVEYRVYDSDGTPSSRFTYKYDARGNKIEESFYSHTGELGGRLVLTYDEKGNQTSQISYNGTGAMHWKLVSTYDAKGNVVERLQYQGQGETLRYQIAFKYDAKGRTTEVETKEFNAVPNVHVSHAPEPGRVVYTYDDEKMTKTVTSYKQDGGLKERLVYTYDAQGTEVARESLKPGGSSSDTVIQFYDNIHEPGSKFRGSLSGRPSTEIEYDEHGNWTKKTYLIQSAQGEKPQPYRAEVRVITYH